MTRLLSKIVRLFYGQKTVKADLMIEILWM